MSLAALDKFLPESALFYIEKWLQPYFCHIRITRKRNSKLGDFRYSIDRKHQISVNGDLDPQLFFFVLTHEIAHLITFDADRRIAPHGIEWKTSYRNLLMESLHLYNEDLQPLIKKFSKTPKANFMAAPDLVKYFHTEEDVDFVEDLAVGSYFEYQNQAYEIIELRKKRYLCKNLNSGRKYLFRACAQVKKLNNED